MGRSVNYLSNAVATFFFHFNEEENDSDTFDYLIEDIQECIKADFPEFDDSDEWEGREVHIILQSPTAEIGISEYCGLVSLSIRVRQDVDFEEGEQEEEAKKIQLQAPIILKNWDEFSKIGTFSNGEAIFQKNKPN